MVSTSEWRLAGSFFKHRGYNIFWREGGNLSGPVLLLVHGFPTASWDWEKIWPGLTQRYRLLTLDMIGFGFSDKPYRYDYRILDQADIYDEFLTDRGVSEYHVFAHDYGDTVTQELVARDMESASRPKLLSVALLNGGLFPETHRRVRFQSLLLSPVGPLFAQLITKKTLDRTMRKVFGPKAPPDEPTLTAIWELIATNHGHRIFHKLIRYIPERIEHRERWVGALRQTPAPLLLIDGMFDPISGAHMVSHFRELVPQAKVTELAGIGHYPQVQAPREVLAAYLSFRDEVDANLAVTNGQRVGGHVSGHFHPH
jgi:pimeloyl-ACP methyl ester carboxylesterase